MEILLYLALVKVGNTERRSITSYDGKKIKVDTKSFKCVGRKLAAAILKL